MKTPEYKLIKQRDYHARVQQIKDAPKFRDYIREILKYEDDDDWDPHSDKCYMREWRKNNKERIKKYGEDYREKNKKKKDNDIKNS